MDEKTVRTFVRLKNVELYRCLEGSRSIRSAIRSAKISQPWAQRLVSQWRSAGLLLRTNGMYRYTPEGRVVDRCLRQFM